MDPIEEFIIQPTRYFWSILCGMWTRFQGWAKLIKLMLAFVFFLILLSCIILLALFGIFPREWTAESIGLLTSDFQTNAIYFFGGICLFAIVFPFLFIYEASKVDEKQRDGIKKLENKTSPDDPFEVIVAPARQPKTGRILVGITIRNTSMRLIHFTVSGQTIEMPNPEILIAEVSTAARDHELTNITLNWGTHIDFYFSQAGTDLQNAFLNFTNEKYRRFSQGELEFSIKISGGYQDDQPIMHSEQYVLVYEGADKLELISAT